MIDRYSSTILNRPFAIQDSDIEVGFPINANDEDIVAANGIFDNLEAFAATLSPDAATEMTVFYFCLRLRQISSKIHSEFSEFLPRTPKQHDPKEFLLTGKVYTVLNKLLLELKH